MIRIPIHVPITGSASERFSRTFKESSVIIRLIALCFLLLHPGVLFSVFPVDEEDDEQNCQDEQERRKYVNKPDHDSLKHSYEIRPGFDKCIGDPLAECQRRLRCIRILNYFFQCQIYGRILYIRIHICQRASCLIKFRLDFCQTCLYRDHFLNRFSLLHHLHQALLLRLKRLNVDRLIVVSLRNVLDILRFVGDFSARTVQQGQELLVFSGRYSDRKVRRESAALLVIGVVVPVIIGIRDRLGFDDSADFFNRVFYGALRFVEFQSLYGHPAGIDQFLVRLRRFYRLRLLRFC